MWSEESDRFLSWSRTADIRESICQWAGRFTNRTLPEFDFERGMWCYALAYLIDLHQGLPLTVYASGIAHHYGRQFTYIARRR